MPEASATGSRVTSGTVPKRIEAGPCVYCWVRPQFWGVRCIICRQRFVKSPLPTAARKALTLQRKAERQREAHASNAIVQAAISELLAKRIITGKQARVWKLYAGLDSRGRKRSYSEVGRIMKISKERVRQLLNPARPALTQIFLASASEARELSNQG